MLAESSLRIIMQAEEQVFFFSMRVHYQNEPKAFAFEQELNSKELSRVPASIQSNGWDHFSVQHQAVLRFLRPQTGRKYHTQRDQSSGLPIPAFYQRNTLQIAY